MDFFKFLGDTQMDITAYVARVEMQFSEYRAASTRVARHTDWTAAWQILATVRPEYQEFSNVRESLDDNKRTMNGLLETLFTIGKRLQTSTTAAESSAFVAYASSTKPQFLAIKMTSITPGRSKKKTKDNRENSICFHCRSLSYLKMKCWKL